MELTEPSTSPPSEKACLPPSGSKLGKYASYLVEHAGFTFATVRVLTSTASYRSSAGDKSSGQELVSQLCRIGQEARRLDEGADSISCATSNHGRIVYIHRYDLPTRLAIEVAGLVSDGVHRKHMPRTVRRLTDRLLRDRESLDCTTAERF